MEIIGTVITVNHMGTQIKIPDELDLITVNQMGLKAHAGDTAKFEENGEILHLKEVSRDGKIIWPRSQATQTSS